MTQSESYLKNGKHHKPEMFTKLFGRSKWALYKIEFTDGSIADVVLTTSQRLWIVESSFNAFIKQVGGKGYVTPKTK